MTPFSSFAHQAHQETVRERAKWLKTKKGKRMLALVEEYRELLK